MQKKTNLKFDNLNAAFPKQIVEQKAEQAFSCSFFWTTLLLRSLLRKGNPKH